MERQRNKSKGETKPRCMPLQDGLSSENEEVVRPLHQLVITAGVARQQGIGQK